LLCSAAHSQARGPAHLRRFGLPAPPPNKKVRGQPLPPNAEDLGEFWARTDAAWQRVLVEAAPRSAIMSGGGAAAADGGGAAPAGRTVVVVAHAAVASALVCHCLGLGPEGLPLFRFAAGGVTVLDFPDGVAGGGALRTLNSTAHLGRWSVPITPEAGPDVCGIDGCF
jgi:broad specificity phosphatase PhoE